MPWQGSVLAVVLLSIVVPLATSPTSPAGSGVAVPVPPPLSAPSGAPCPGSEATGPFSGTVVVDAGPLSSNGSAGLGIVYSYSEEFATVPFSGGPPTSVGCVGENGSTTTTANGSFTFTPTTPATFCGPGPNGTVCTEYAGPFGPVSAAPRAPLPAGYALSVVTGSPRFTLALVWELANVSVTPSGPTVTISADAPTFFDAEGWMANGSASPLAVTYNWALNGTGWAFTGNSSGPRIGVEAVPGASVASLEVTAAATDDGVRLAPPPVGRALVAVATTIERGELNRTLLDAGASVSFDLTAIGAAGYAYRAAVSPGLGLPSVPLGCATGAEGPGTVAVHCSTNVTYPAPGTAQPSASLTNGYSTDSWRFPAVTIDPPPELLVTPSDPTGYAGVAVAIDLSAAAGSGAPPYARACLAPGVGSIDCRSTPGPTWSFDPVYAAPGTYRASAWAVDADGTNRSVAFVVTVVPPLALGPIAISPANVTVRGSVQLTANLSGGLLPGRLWWNSSGSPTTLFSSAATADGRLSVSFIPSAAGPLEVLLTVVDALGSTTEVDRVLEVAPPPAVLVVSTIRPPATPVSAGSNVTLAWGAFDVGGAPVRSFASVDSIILTGPGSAPPDAWINASGTGPLPSLGNGVFGVPAAAWVGGVLNVSLVPKTAGELSVVVTGASLPNAVAPLVIHATPDRGHVRLYAPTFAHPGTRSNATFWHLEDRFGNPAAGAILTVRLAFGFSSVDTLVAAVPLPDGSSGVWINFTAPGPSSGTVSVLDAAGATLLGPIAVAAVPAPPGPDPTVAAVATAVPAGAVGIAVSTVVVRRRHRSRLAAGEVELRRLAEGRATIVEIVRRAGSAGLGEIEAAWTPPPAPRELADWLASLATDGTLGATVGDDGRARFCLAEPTGDPPEVRLDRELLEQALRRRDEELGDPPPSG